MQNAKLLSLSKSSMVRLFLCVVQYWKAQHTMAYVSIYNASKVQKEPTRTIFAIFV